jgi:hypothetical protein
MDPFTQALRDWQNFYFMIGSASATLMGLLFVALSVGAGRAAPDSIHSVRAFVTPSYSYFFAVLLVAAIMLIPSETFNSLGCLLGIFGLGNIGYALLQFWRMLQHHQQRQPLDPDHWFWFFLFPLVSYLLIVGSAIGVWNDVLPYLNVVAVAVIMLLVVSLRNAWHTFVWIIYRL